MANNVGFLEQLGVPDLDERAVARQQIQRQIAEGGTAGIFNALGRQASPLIGSLLGGVTGAVSPGEGESRFGGFKQGLKQGLVSGDQALVAQMNGISPQQLQGRQAIRQELAKTEYKDDGSYGQREKIAARVAEIAMKTGNPEIAAQAIAQLDAVRKERKEFERLEAEEGRREEKGARDNVVDAYKDGKPVTGLHMKQDGEWGLLLGDGQFVPWGSKESGNLYRNDPEAVGGESLDGRIRKLTSKSFRDEVNNQLRAGSESIHKFDRVLSTMKDLYERGGASEIISKSGTWLSFMDNAILNVKGLVSAFVPPSARRADERADPNREWSGIKTWLDKANDPKDEVWKWFNLPDWAKDASAAAQQHRAQIMELAYMAARLAEPSNRGLSDNDIKNALARIAGDTSNPQVLFRRFAELMGDAAYSIEDMMDSVRGSIEGVEDADIDRVLGGKLYPIYKQRQQALFAKYGIRMGRDGRATFDEVVGPDVQPGEGVGEPENMAPKAGQRATQSRYTPEQRSRLEALGIKVEED